MTDEVRDLTVRQAAELMQTHEETIRNWLRRGLLPNAYKTPTGYGWRIPRSALEAVMKTPEGDAT